MDWDKNLAVLAGSDLKSPPAITRLVREAAFSFVAVPGPIAQVAPQGRGRPHLLSLMVESPRKRVPESGKPAWDESGVPLAEMIPVAIKLDNAVVPIKASSKPNYLPGEERSTISNSNIPFRGPRTLLQV